MKVLAIIPARYASKRFPGKPLALICGKTLIQRTYETAKKCPLLDYILIATDDERIYSHTKKFAPSKMTEKHHPNGTSRIIEVLEKDKKLQEFDVVINIQGDHPHIDKNTIESIVNLLKGKEKMATAATLMNTKEEILSKDNVKVVFDNSYNALYFSRSAIPFSKNLNANYYQHIGIYAYKTDFLLFLKFLKDTPLQQEEDLEQLKILEHGYNIKIACVKENPLNVDVKEDICKVEKFLCQ